MPRSRSHITILSILLLLAASMLGNATPAMAQQVVAAAEATPDVATPAPDAGPRFVIYPKGSGDGEYFTLEAEPDTTTELVVVLGNADDEPLSLRTYVSNVLPIPNGGFSLGDESQIPEGTTTWLDYPAETFEFAPGQGVERTFSVTIPEDAEPGQYITGLALETAEPLEVEGTRLFEQIIRKTIAVFIIVPGPDEPAFALGEPEVVYQGQFGQVIIPVENTGNVLLGPKGEVTIRDAEGEVVVTSPVAMGSVYAGFTVPLSVSLTTPLAGGDYTVSVKLTDEATGAAASIDEAPITIVSEEELARQITVEGTVSLTPDAVDPSFADVALTVTNPAEVIPNAEVVLDVTRDGDVVETFPMGPAFALPQGETELTQRYVPPTGWESGTWTFVVRVNAVDASTGTATTVATFDDLAPVEVGE